MTDLHCAETAPQNVTGHVTCLASAKGLTDHDNQDPRGWLCPYWANRVFHGLVDQMVKHRMAAWPHSRNSDPLDKLATGRDVPSGFPTPLQREPKAIGHWIFFLPILLPCN